MPSYIDSCRTFAILRVLAAPSAPFDLPHNGEHVVLIPPKPVWSRHREATPPPEEDIQAFALTFDKMKDLNRGYVFGRDPIACDVLLDTKGSRGISREQFRISFASLDDPIPEHIIVENLSGNGTTVNHDKLSLGRSVTLSPTFGVACNITIGFFHMTLEIPVRNLQSESMRVNWDLYREAAKQALPRVGNDQLSSDLPVTAVVDVRNKILGVSKLVYVLGEELGQGANGTVYSALREADNKQVAVKVARVVRRRTRKSFLQVHILERVRHQNLTQLFDYASIEDRIWLFLEYAPFGDLLSHMRTYGSPGLPEHQTKDIAVQMLKALIWKAVLLIVPTSGR
jgi:hypothetical protein